MSDFSLDWPGNSAPSPAVEPTIREFTSTTEFETQVQWPRNSTPAFMAGIDKTRDALIYSDDPDQDILKARTSAYIADRMGAHPAIVFQNFEQYTEDFFGKSVLPESAWKMVGDDWTRAVGAIEIGHLGMALQFKSWGEEGRAKESTMELLERLENTVAKLPPMAEGDRPFWSKALGSVASFAPSIGATLAAGWMGAKMGSLFGPKGTVIGGYVGALGEAAFLAGGNIWTNIALSQVPGTDKSVIRWAMEQEKKRVAEAAERLPYEQTKEAFDEEAFIQKFIRTAALWSNAGGILSGLLEMPQLELIAGGLLGKVVTENVQMLSQKILTDKFVANAFTRFVTTAGINTGIQVVQENLQETVEYVSENLANLDIGAQARALGVPEDVIDQWDEWVALQFNPDTWMEMVKDVTVTTALGAGIIGLPGSARMARNQAIMQEREKMLDDGINFASGEEDLVASLDEILSSGYAGRAEIDVSRETIDTSQEQAPIRVQQTIEGRAVVIPEDEARLQAYRELGVKEAPIEVTPFQIQMPQEISAETLAAANEWSTRGNRVLIPGILNQEILLNAIPEATLTEEGFVEIPLPDTKETILVKTEAQEVFDESGVNKLLEDLRQEIDSLPTEQQVAAFDRLEEAVDDIARAIEQGDPIGVERELERLSLADDEQFGISSDWFGRAEEAANTAEEINQDLGAQELQIDPTKLPRPEILPFAEAQEPRQDIAVLEKERLSATPERQAQIDEELLRYEPYREDVRESTTRRAVELRIERTPDSLIREYQDRPWAAEELARRKAIRESLFLYEDANRIGSLEEFVEWATSDLFWDGIVDLEGTEEVAPSGLAETKVVDSEGNPLRVYHGSTRKNARDLDPRKGMEVRGAVFFADNEDIADLFTLPREYGEIIFEELDPETGEYVDIEGGDVTTAYLDIRNPAIFKGKEAQKISDDTALQTETVNKAKSDGHDGIILEDISEGPGIEQRPGTTYAVFNSDQIVYPTDKKADKAKQTPGEKKREAFLEALPADEEARHAFLEEIYDQYNAKTPREIENFIDAIGTDEGLTAWILKVPPQEAAKYLPKSWLPIIQSTHNKFNRFNDAVGRGEMSQDVYQLTPTQAGIIRRAIERRPYWYQRQFYALAPEEEFQRALDAEGGHDYATQVYEEVMGREVQREADRVGQPKWLKETDTTDAGIDAQLNKLKEEIAGLKDALKSAREEARKTASERAKERVKKVREQYREKQERQRILKKAKEEKKRIARRILRPISRGINLNYRDSIELIQVILDPEYRRADKIEDWKKAFADFTARYPDSDVETLLKEWDIKPRPLNLWTMAELDALFEFTEDMRRKGRLRQQVIDDNVREYYRNSIKDYKAQFDAQGPPPEFADPGTRQGKKKGRTPLARRFIYSGFRIPRLARIIDGNTEGAAFDMMVNKVNEGSDNAIRWTRRRWDAGHAYLRSLGLTQNGLAQMYRVNTRRELSRNEMIGVWIFDQNENSARALRKGNDFSEEEISIIKQELTEEEKAWGAWMIQDFQRNLGRMEAVYEVWMNQHMKLEDAYFPMWRRDKIETGKPDDFWDEFATRNEWHQSVNRSQTKARQKNESNRQGSIELSSTEIWHTAVDKHEYWTNMGLQVRDMGQWIKDPDITSRIKGRYGVDVYQMFKQYVEDVANPTMHKGHTGLAKASRLLRRNIAAGYLSLNALTMLKQAPSIMLFMRDAGPHHLLGAVGQYLSNPKKWQKFVDSRDPQMFDRVMTLEQELLREAQKGLYGQVVGQIGRAGFAGIRWVDKTVTHMGWLAVYNANVHKLGEKEAIRRAQLAVLETQPAARAKDLAHLYRQGEPYGWFLMFTNQLNQHWNLLAADLPFFLRSQQYGRAVGSLTGLGISIFTMMILSGWRPGDAEEEGAREGAVPALMAQLANTIPMFGKTLSSGIEGWMKEGLEPMPVVNTLGIVIGEGIEAISGEDAELTEAFWDVMIDAMLVFGLPVTGAFQRPRKALQEEDIGYMLGSAYRGDE